MSISISNLNEPENIKFEENFADLFENSIEEEKKEGEVVKGRVLNIENDVVIIDIGLKNEGRVPLREFTDHEGKSDIEIGSEVEVYFERVEGSYGYTALSREKAVRQQAWTDLETNCEDGDTVDGVIFGRVKGGFTVDLKGVIAFLPGSQVDVRPVKDISPLMNITQPFQILKIDSQQGNVVVSRRAILEESRQEERTEMLSKISEGIILDGVVKNITDYGAFIDLGSLDGLLHVTDISWTRISHPSEILTVGDEIKVKVIKFNEETKRISLGIKQLDGNPWENVEERFPKGSVHTGRVTNITDYGAFVEISEGIEGLVHVSEISWIKTNTHPNKLLKPSQEVQVMILDIDTTKHRISMGMKQCNDNPWQEFAANNPVGSVIESEVRNTVDFGLFVGFEGGVDGLVHMSDISWEENSDEIKKYQIGDKVNVKVLSVEPTKERISLGIKQLIEDPRSQSFSGLKRNDVVTCVVSAIKDEGVEVTINENLKSVIRRNDLASERVEQRPDRFAVGDKVDAKITSVDKNNGTISVSIRALEVAEQKKAIEEYGSADSGASLGDILGAALNNASSDKK